MTSRTRNDNVTSPYSYVKEYEKDRKSTGILHRLNRSHSNKKRRLMKKDKLCFKYTLKHVILALMWEYTDFM